MSLPWVTRAAFDLVCQERDWLRKEVDRLSDEARRLTDAVMTNARLVPVFERRPDRRTPVRLPLRKSAIAIARELEAKERG